MSRWWLVATSIVAFCAWTIWCTMPLWAPATFTGWGLDKAGQWGDAFGALNALFGALGFIAIVTTLFLQQRGLEKQQNELHRDRFEGSFFQLLDLMRTLRGNISFSPDVGHLGAPTVFHGLDAINAALSAVRTQSTILESMKDPGLALGAHDLAEWYDEEILPRSQNGLGPYFRVIYNMLDRIDTDAVLTDKEKADYGNLLRGQLNDDEILLIGINALSRISKDFRRLVIQFRLLKYAPEGAMREALVRSYPASAFKGRDGV